MHAEDDRYAKLFLFTEKEVTILCETHSEVRSLLNIPYPFTVLLQLSIEMLQLCYDGYAATCGSGLVKLYNPFSVVRALSVQRICNFWVDTGKKMILSGDLN